MDALLFLAHRLPYPPNKGDKIRSWHLLRYLAERYRVHLGTFIDDEDDWQHVSRLQSLCAEVFVRPLPAMRARLRSLRGLLTGQPLTLPYYRDAALARWTRDVIRREDIHAVLAFSSAMGQYAISSPGRPLLRVMDFVDVDSDKWRQYSERKSWPMNWIYRREARCLSRYEQRIAGQWDASLLVSEAEAQLLRERTGIGADRIHALNNGVDLEYFRPDREFANPYEEGVKPLVFTGAMDYWANVDAVTWFVESVWPLIRARAGTAKFHIVGARPAPEVQQLARVEGVVVTGTVPDVRPYLAHASMAVAPLRVARGIQNKVLEAMAMELPLVITPAAADGIPLDGLADVVVADAEQELAEACLRRLGSPARAPSLRDRVCTHFDWNRNLSCLDQWFHPAAAMPATAVTA